VVRDVKDHGLREEPVIVYYAPLAQFGSMRTSLVVRSAVPPDDVVRLMRRAMSTLDPQVPLYDVRTLDDKVAAAMGPERTMAALVRGFAVLSVRLAALGLYGVLSYWVARRTHEIGVRLGPTEHRAVPASGDRQCDIWTAEPELVR